MSGSILIVDEAVKSRTVLKVQLSSSFPDVTVASSGEEALARARRLSPALILFSDSLPDLGAETLCRSLRAFPESAQAKLGVLVHETDSASRARLLTAGADDIFTRDQPEALLLARLRCLIRARGTEEEMSLRDSTDQAFSLAEPAATFEQPGRIALITARAGKAIERHRALARLSRHEFKPFPVTEALRWMRGGGAADVIVLDLDGADRADVTAVIVEARTRPTTRHAEILLITEDHDNPLLAEALDHGANAVMPYGFTADEALLRIGALLRRKQIADRMRRRLRDGLRESVTDALTGLYNRRYAEPYMERLAAGAGESGTRPFAVVLADIDHFKEVNDRFGHKAGDAVLMAVADLLRDNLRARDLVARFGGEEFLIVMPDTRESEAQMVAERLRRRLAEAPIGAPGMERPIHVSISLGVCVDKPRDDIRPTDHVARMVERADRALYAAKSGGRNRVKVADTG